MWNSLLNVVGRATQFISETSEEMDHVAAKLGNQILLSPTTVFVAAVTVIVIAGMVVAHFHFKRK